MDRQYGDIHFVSKMVQDLTDGFVGYELLQTQHGKNSCAAKVLFWDASGQFFVETLGCDVPLEIIEELISEAKANIKVR